MEGAMHQAVAKELGHNLARARHCTGLSQEALGELAAVHRTEVGYIEVGKRLPRVDTLIKLAGALDTGIEGLVEGIGWVLPAGSRPGRFVISPRT
jgi:transcriptional regulator with XRE-family HTH domain